MAAHHHHHHAHPPGPDGSAFRLVASILLNLLITIAEVVGGLLSGSLALLSDALHNFSDTSSLVISYVAQRIGKRTANPQKTFGYKRAEIIGAFINLVTLVIIALYLIKEGITRLFEPQSIDGPIMLIVAVIGLLANVFTALLLWRDARSSLNIRSAFLHIISDAVSSVGVVIGGILIWQYGFYLVDPILTLLISLYILVHSYRMLRETIDILMESTPAHLSLEHVIRAIEATDRVRDAHHLHVWQLDEAVTALEAHIVIDKQDLEQMEVIKRAVKHMLAERFAISHTTLEFETRPCSPATDERCYEQDEGYRSEDQREEAPA